MSDRQSVRKLLRELSRAIHESLAGSEKVAASVERIRLTGNDVYLTLEAAVAPRRGSEAEDDPDVEPLAIADDDLFDEADESPVATLGAAAADGLAEAEAAWRDGANGDSPWNRQDLEFLRELRIRIV